MRIVKASRRAALTVVLVTILASALAAAGTETAEPSAPVKGIPAPVASRIERALEFQYGYVPGEVIVKLRDGRADGLRAFTQDAVLRTHQAILLRLQAECGVEEQGPVFQRVHTFLGPQGAAGGGGRIGFASPRGGTRPLQQLELLGYYVLKTERDVRTVCAELRADPDVELVQPNYTYRICRTPDDPDFPDQYAHQLIRMEDAWEISTGSRDIVVGVIDTGVDANHPDLKDNIWVNGGEVPNNKLDDDGNGYVDDIHGWNFKDDNNKVSPTGSSSSIISHGTQVSGVIAAVGNNGKGVTGVNWQCSIMALRMSTSVTSDEVAAALDYAAANGAHVVNMSFGGDDFGPDGDPIVKTAIDNAYAQGVLLVASAGNSDSSRAHYPAAYHNVMAVSSTNGEDMKTGHSTFGLWVDIAAPGTDIVTTTLGNEYISTAGTSFSGPYVAAVAALLLAHRPELTHIEARAILENTTDPIYYGDLDPNLGYIGTGRVNAYNALLAADEKYALAGIVAPRPQQTFAADANAIDLCLFVHGDAYRLDWRLYGQSEWTLIDQGGSPADPDGFVYVSLANPGVGAYELRLVVSKGLYRHTDRRVFGVEIGPSQAHWPKPEDVEESDEVFMGSPLCLDIDSDGRNEIIQSSLDLSTYFGDGKVNIWDQDGNPLDHWPVLTGYAWPTSTAVGDIDGDGDYEVVVACEYDGEVHAYHIETGKMVDGKWPVAVGGWYGWIPSGPVLADLDGDGDSEIVIAMDMESADTDGLVALQGDGTYLWQRRYTSAGPISAADINGDGRVEIALSGLGPGLNRAYTFILDRQGQQITRVLGGGPMGTVVADLDADGKPEVVFCSDKEIMAMRANGSVLWRTRVLDPLDTGGGLSVGDLDDDGFSEVYVNVMVEENGFVFSRVYALDHRGRQLTDAGFPKTIMGAPARCIPLIADIDGDGRKELVVGSAGEPMMAWEADGSVTPGFPALNLVTDIETSPALADLDRDGDVELMIAADDYRFHVLDLPAPYDRARIDWGMVRHDPQNSGWTMPIPRVNPLSVPTEIMPGQRLQVQLTASNPGNMPLRWVAGNLAEGAYYDADSQTLFWKPAADQVFRTYTFSFLVTDGIRQDSRSVSVTVVPDAIYHASMDADPNWTLDEGWAWGTPAGSGSWNRDPNTGRTGQNVIGYALDGDYANLMQPRYATTGPIDCRGYRNIRLSFWRWLGVESPYDWACVQVSNDGVTWTDLWTVGLSHVSDSAWQLMEYAVPAGIADNQSTVYFRWGLGPTDESVTCPGWNIDDVQVTGDRM